MKKELKLALNGDLKDYRSTPFWSWNNSLNEKELVKQIDEMKAAGIGGFIMHARTGLKDEYLGEKWFSCVETCLKKARETGMSAWVYDENGWPSGFVGGKLLENENFRARYLEYVVGKYDEKAFSVYISDDKKGFIRIEKPQEDINEYHNVYLQISPANTDILNPEVVDAFIAETHEKYYARFKEYFGKELVGFFTDEPQYYRYATPYTHIAEKEFELSGENIKDGLIWLFKHDERGYKMATDRENYRLKYCDMLGYPLNTNDLTLKDGKKSYVCEINGIKIYRTSIIVGEIPVYGMYFEIDKNLPFVICLHGGDGTPELISGINLDSGNYNHLVQRIAERGANVYCPQFLLWNIDRYGIPFNRHEIDGRLRQLGGSITALEVLLMIKSMKRKKRLT